MKISFFTDYTGTSPRSKGFVWLPETPSDKLAMVELIDLPECRRATSVEEMNAGRTGRVLTKSLKAHLRSEGASEEYGKALLTAVSKEFGVSWRELLDHAFYIRMFEK
jgi:hypothetical protein